jgi:predicted polyphosphate/ATP-dependent NAD kinase
MANNVRRLGLIVNPVAGMGGAVGLKGTDGPGILERAIALGAEPGANRRAMEALERLRDHREELEIVTFPGEMGATVSKRAGFRYSIFGETCSRERTSFEDTVKAARLMVSEGVDIILFAGGDGTARDMVSAVGTGIPVIGIPAGVKIHSPVFARNPSAAGDLARLYLFGPPTGLRELEVMDIDEESFRQGRVSTSLFGYLSVPYERSHLQGGKSGSPRNEAVEVDGAARETVSRMFPGVLYLVGPGSTTASLMRIICCPFSLLGVDAVKDGRTLGKDLSKNEILERIEPGNTRMIITVIGGQGFIFGRGNQQIGPEVIRIAGKENIIVVAAPSKIRSLPGRSLFVDTGDPYLDEDLCGYIRVVTGPSEETLVRVRR